MKNLKIGYDYHRIDNSYSIVDVKYEGKNSNEISNIYTLKALSKIIDLYKTMLSNVENILLSIKGKVILNINRDFNSIKIEFVNVPKSLQDKIVSLV